VIVKLRRKTAHPIYKLADGSRVAGASTISKVGEDFTHLLNWANDLGLQGIDHNKEREEAADAGSVCHFLIQCFLKQDTPDLTEFSPRVIELATIGYNKFVDWWTGEGLTMIGCEIPLVSELYRFGGTIDLVAKDKSDNIWLTDQKTSKRIYLSHLIQASAYKQLYNENNPLLPAKKTSIIRIDRKDSGDFEVRPIYDTEKYFQVFLAQLNLYNAKRIL
jgi:hypothetical protein